MTGYTVRFLESADLLAVGRLHCEAFPDDIRSQLGAKVMAKSFARKLSRQVAVHGLGAFNSDGTLLGFCFGGVNGDAAQGLDIYDLPLLGASLLFRPHLLRRLDLMTRLRERLSKNIQEPESENDRAALPTAAYYDIISLAVSAKSRRLGIGKTLVAYHKAYAVQAECMAMSLFSPIKDQETLAFYEHLEFRKRVDVNGVWHGKMVMVLQKPPVNSPKNLRSPLSSQPAPKNAERPSRTNDKADSS
mgnify:CR=1 FL=1